ncbi:replication protein [Metabacillus indicus]|uniref:replication protein n=1 Tax=Metabacillus indicus TaxID=246786 RepID=UPI0029FFA6B5|nr:replication protein [Metabacillus indicus]MDX8291416.1 replication protein [Metabacillus indicus]
MSRIKGITIEIGHDTVGLEGALRDVNQRSKDLAKELKDVERLLKFDPNNTELLAQRQELLSQSIGSTTQKLEQLRAAEAQVQAQFEAGTIGEEQYRGFRREIQQTEQQLQTYQQAMTDMAREQEKVGQGTRQLGAFFEATGTSVQDYANVIGNRLVTAIQNGSATSRDLEYAFQRIGRQAIGANGDIEQLRATLASVDSGNSIQNIRWDIQRLQMDLQDTEEAVEGVGIGLENVAGALVVGGGLAGAVEQALDTSSLDTKIKLSMEIPPESIGSVKEAVKQIEAYGVDGEAALEGIRRQWALNKNATDEQNASLVKMAGTVAASYAGVDFNELIQETNEIAASLKITNEDAIALTNSLLKAGFPPEQLDTISEYGTQMQLAGFDAKEIQAIFEAGIDTKTWNIDNLNDGVKEARLTMSGFGLEVPKALKPLIEDAGISAKKFQDWGKAVAAGGEEGSKAMSEVSTWLEGIDNKELKNELATKVFGTKWEDQGANMISVFQGVATAADKTAQNTRGLQEQMDTLDADPMVQMKTAVSDLMLALAPVLTVVASMISKVAEWISKNPELAAAIVAVTTAVGVLAAGLLALAPIFAGITTAAGLLGISVGALVGIVAGVVVAIGALVAAGVWLYQNWDTVKEKAILIWEAVKTYFSLTWENIVTTAIAAWTAFTSWFSQMWTSMLTGITTFLTSMITWFSQAWTSVIKSTTAFLTSIATWLSQTWTNMLTSTTTFLINIAKWFSQTWTNMISATKSFLTSILTFFTNTWTNVRTKTQEVWNGIQTSIFSVWDSIKTGAYQKFDAVRSTIQQAMNNVKSTVTSIWSSIRSTITNAASGIVSSVSGKFSETVSTIRSKMNQAWDTVRSAMSNIKSAFNIDLYASGKAIIQSAIDGLSAMKGKILRKVEDIVGAVRDFWPFSPAKRGPLSDIHRMDFAGPIGDSIENARHPLERAMSSLASRVSNSMAGMTAIQVPMRANIGDSDETYSPSRSRGTADVAEAGGHPEYVLVHIDIDKTPIAKVLAKPIRDEMNLQDKFGLDFKGLIT